MAQRRQQLEQTMAALEARYGAGVVRRAASLRPQVPHLSTGFPQLDALTGCGGVPLGRTTILSGQTTSGKLTVAFKALVAAQSDPRSLVALLDCNHTADPDYLARAGLDLARLLIARPRLTPQVVDLLLDLARSRKVRALLVNGLADLQSQPPIYRRLCSHLSHLHVALRAGHCALIWIDEPSPAWLRWFNWDRSSPVRQWAALHLDLRRETWLTQEDGALCGYEAQARLLKSRWTRSGKTASVAITFNGVVKARATW
ncbi:MAG TPA: hypothetical protein VNK95_17260 [Caldilineaceae bacterium]|nr:hypothetical protein [Caldilineaceae bacterium]